MASRIAFIVLAACAACGGGGGNQTFATGSASISGTIGGQTMTAKDAISVVLQNTGIIVISNADSHCAKINARQTPRNLQAIVIGIGTQTSPNSITPPAGPGVFPVYSTTDSQTVTGPAAVVLFQSNNATCQPTASYESVTGGNVTLTRVDANGYAGTFDITFSASAGHITGSFTSAQCAPLATIQPGTCT